MRLRPLNDTIIIEPDPLTGYEGDLIIPEKNSIMKRSPFATVVSCGSKCYYSFKPGQRIVIDRWFEEGRDGYFKMADKQYRFIKEHYVIGVLEDEA